MNDSHTDIVMVLDRSGSMTAVASDTIGGFNTFLEDQKKVPGEATLTLVQFDNQYEVLHDAKPIKQVEPLTDKTSVPRGSTALLDAVGQTINSTGARYKAMDENKRPGKVIFVIITDGQENASKEFTREKVFEMIKHQREKYKWEFNFIGADQDAFAAGSGLGIAASNSLSSANNAVGVRGMYASVSKVTTKYRKGGPSGQCVSADFDADDRDTQKKAGAVS